MAKPLHNHSYKWCSRKKFYRFNRPCIQRSNQKCLWLFGKEAGTGCVSERSIIQPDSSIGCAISSLWGRCLQYKCGNLVTQNLRGNFFQTFQTMIFRISSEYDCLRKEQELAASQKGASSDQCHHWLRHFHCVGVLLKNLASLRKLFPDFLFWLFQTFHFDLVICQSCFQRQIFSFLSNKDGKQNQLFLQQ